jgi:hypothetical protein
MRLAVLAAGGADPARLGEALGALASSAHLGRSNARLERVLQVVLVEVLGPFDLPLPIALLCDGEGQLVAIHADPVDVPRLLQDAERAGHLDPSSGSTELVSGGRWIAQGGRDLAVLGSVFQMLGERELAQYYAELLRGAREE